MAIRLDNKLDCKSCGTVYLAIPVDVDDDTSIACSTCGAWLGTWGVLRRDFDDQVQFTTGAFDLSDGQIDERHPYPASPPEGE